MNHKPVLSDHRVAEALKQPRRFESNQRQEKIQIAKAIEC